VAGRPKSYGQWSRDLANWLQANRTLEVFKRPGSKECSRPGETERDFRIRLREAAREGRDRWKDELRKRYAPKLGALEERLRRAQQAVEREKGQAMERGLQTAVSVGATILGAVLGRKGVSASTLGRATTAARGVGRVLKEQKDVGRAQETVDAIRQQLGELDAQFKSEMAALEAMADPLTERLETVVMKPKKSNVSVQLVALVWAPYWQDVRGTNSPAWV
jgi:hypothetical protein